MSEDVGIFYAISIDLRLTVTTQNVKTFSASAIQKNLTFLARPMQQET